MPDTPSARTGATATRAQYLERVLGDANLRPEIVPAELRLEAGEPVAGLVVSALRDATPDSRRSRSRG